VLLLSLESNPLAASGKCIAGVNNRVSVLRRVSAFVDKADACLDFRLNRAMTLPVEYRRLRYTLLADWKPSVGKRRL